MLYCGPSPGPAIKVKGFANFIKQCTGIIGLKLKASTCTSLWVKLLHRVVKAPSGPNNWSSAVTHTGNLIQSARLVKRRQQEHIRARFDLLTEPPPSVTV